MVDGTELDWSLTLPPLQSPRQRALDPDAVGVCLEVVEQVSQDADYEIQ